MTDRMLAFMRRGAVPVLVGDPGRAYAPTRVATLATYDIRVIRDLEGTDVKRVNVVRIP